MDTNNGTEAQNKLFKYCHLPRSSKLTLSHLLTIIMESLLPESHQKYLFDNFKLGAAYRSYNDIVPQFLQGRPRKVILHCLQRMTKAGKFLQSNVSLHKSATSHEVHSHASGKTHNVDVKIPQCSCKDWLRYNMPCKHMFAVFKYCTECSWDSLPETYKQSEYLSADSAMLGETAMTSDATMENSPELMSVHKGSTSEIPTKVHIHIKKSNM